MPLDTNDFKQPEILNEAPVSKGESTDEPNPRKPEPYQPSREMRHDLAMRFTHHPPHGDQVERYRTLRDAAHGVGCAIVALCPPSREQALALTNLEQAVMWANAAIARNEEHKRSMTDSDPNRG